MSRLIIVSKIHPRFYILGLVQILASTAAGVALTVVTPVALRLSGSVQVSGLAQTSMILGASVLTLPITRLAQRSGRNVAMALAFALATAGTAGILGAVAAEAWPLLLIFLFLLGGGTVGGLATRFAAAETVDNPVNVPVAISMILWTGTLGALLGPNLVSIFGLQTNLGPFLLLLALYVSATCLAYVGAPRKPAVAEWTRKRLSFSEILQTCCLHPRAVDGLTVTLVSHAAMVALMGMAPVHLNIENNSPTVVGLIMSAHMVAMYALSPVFGLLARQFGARFLGRAGLTSLGASAILIGASNAREPGIFAAGLALLGLGWSMGIIAGSALVSSEVSEPERGTFQGLADLTMNVSGGLASISAGLVMATWSYNLLAWVTSSLVFAVLVVIEACRYFRYKNA
ncbi:MFS transporter [Mycetocola saprophilus]|uniref:MFS transporter n=1 Tax=Mycetocola saprophilus TaxID=76636 RepID=UPI003BF19806